MPVAAERVAHDVPPRVVLATDFSEASAAATRAAFAYARLPGLEATLTAQLDGALRLKSGSPLALQAPAAACHLFDAQGLAFKRRAAAE